MRKTLVRDTNRIDPPHFERVVRAPAVRWWWQISRNIPRLIYIGMCRNIASNPQDEDPQCGRRKTASFLGVRGFSRVRKYPPVDVKLSGLLGGLCVDFIDVWCIFFVDFVVFFIGRVYRMFLFNSVWAKKLWWIRNMRSYRSYMFIFKFVALLKWKRNSWGWTICLINESSYRACWGKYA